MKASERDALFARLDERSKNTWHTVEKMEQHQEITNGRLRKVENKVWYLFGLLAVVSSGAGTAIFLALR